MNTLPAGAQLETDPRFSSGPWTGFYMQQVMGPRKFRMELKLTFQAGQLTGEGLDGIGRFVMRGRYSTADGKCYWTKRYVGMHDVSYQGFNEGKGIWGTWEIPGCDRGGFHIWPEGMTDATHATVSAEADLPDAIVDVVPELIPAPQETSEKVRT